MADSQKKVLLKVIILGESGVGKTAILNKYVNQQFIEAHKATIGADFMTKEIKVDDNKLVTLQMWDTAGQERFKSLGNSFYRGADAAILVYDITNQESFNKIEEWRDSFMKLSSDSSENKQANDFPILLLGNKSDLANQQRNVDINDGKQYAQNKGIQQFYETSAVNGNNIETAIQAIAKEACDKNTAPLSIYIITQCFTPH